MSETAATNLKLVPLGTRSPDKSVGPLTEQQVMHGIVRGKTNLKKAKESQSTFVVVLPARDRKKQLARIGAHEARTAQEPQP